MKLSDPLGWRLRYEMDKRNISDFPRRILAGLEIREGGHGKGFLCLDMGAIKYEQDTI